MIRGLISGLFKLLAGFLGLSWLRRDAVKDASAKADLQAHERLNDVQDTGALTDDERVKRLSDLGKRLGG